MNIIVFGSLAEGRVRSSSDMDLLAIMPPAMAGKQWMERIYETVDLQVDSDILAFAEDELEKALPISEFSRPCQAMSVSKRLTESRATYHSFINNKIIREGTPRHLQ